LRGDRSRTEAAAKRLSFEQLRDDVRRSLVRAEVVDRRDVRVVEDSGRARFLLEALEAIGVLGERRGKDFDRDLAAEAGVLRAVHLAHPPGTELG